jgi:hypothetical protein
LRLIIPYNIDAVQWLAKLNGGTSKNYAS